MPKRAERPPANANNRGGERRAPAPPTAGFGLGAAPVAAPAAAPGTGLFVAAPGGASAAGGGASAAGGGASAAGGLFGTAPAWQMAPSSLASAIAAQAPAPAAPAAASANNRFGPYKVGKAYKCPGPTCQKTFETERQLVSHMRTHEASNAARAGGRALVSAFASPGGPRIPNIAEAGRQFAKAVLLQLRALLTDEPTMEAFCKDLEKPYTHPTLMAALKKINEDPKVNPLFRVNGVRLISERMSFGQQGRAELAKFCSLLLKCKALSTKIEDLEKSEGGVNLDQVYDVLVNGLQEQMFLWLYFEWLKNNKTSEIQLYFTKAGLLHVEITTNSFQEGETKSYWKRFVEFIGGPVRKYPDSFAEIVNRLAYMFASKLEQTGGEYSFRESPRPRFPVLLVLTPGGEYKFPSMEDFQLAAAAAGGGGGGASAAAGGGGASAAAGGGGASAAAGGGTLLSVYRDIKTREARMLLTNAVTKRGSVNVQAFGLQTILDKERSDAEAAAAAAAAQAAADAAAAEAVQAAARAAARAAALANAGNAAANAQAAQAAVVEAATEAAAEEEQVGEQPAEEAFVPGQASQEELVPEAEGEEAGGASAAPKEGGGGGNRRRRVQAGGRRSKRKHAAKKRRTQKKSTRR